MIDTDKYEGHSEGEWYWSPEGLRCETHLVYLSHNNVLWNGTPPHPPIDMRLIADAPILLQEVKRLREREKFLIGELTNAKQVMITAVRDTLDSFSTCPSCDELTETFVDFIPEGLRGEMLLQRRDPESFWYKGEEE
jgi:hypothetical protein